MLPRKFNNAEELTFSGTVKPANIFSEGELSGIENTEGVFSLCHQLGQYYSIPAGGLSRRVSIKQKWRKVSFWLQYALGLSRMFRISSRSFCCVDHLSASKVINQVSTWVVMSRFAKSISSRVCIIYSG